MNEHLDPVLLTLALLVWPITKSLVFMGAAAITLFSRNPARRARARRILRSLNQGSDDRSE